MSRSRTFLAVAALGAALLTTGAAGSAAQTQDASSSPSVGPSPSPVVAGTPTTSPTLGPLAGIELLVRGTPDPGLVVADEDLAAVVHGNTAFALDLYRQVASSRGNLVLGPLSISTAMAMEQMGARGVTADQIAAAMHFDLPDDRLAAGFDRLDRELEGLAGPKVTVSLVNQLFGQQGHPFEDAFLATLSSRFGAPLAVVDYSDPEAVRLLINAWVASQTADRIKDLLAPGILSESTKLVVANATYLKADWAQSFNAALTQPRTFHLASGKTVKVPMMAAEEGFPIALGKGYRALELPYDGDRLAMLIVVPDDLAAFQQRLTADSYDAIVGALHPRTLDLRLPRFAARASVDLAGPLKALGIVDAFDPALADLSGISPEGLSVGAVVHQAFVEVAEKGTEAAAATVVESGDSGFERPPLDFRIDRPFLWFIRDRVTGSVLFMGRVEDPRDTVK